MTCWVGFGRGKDNEVFCRRALLFVLWCLLSFQITIMELNYFNRIVFLGSLPCNASGSFVGLSPDMQRHWKALPF